MGILLGPLVMLKVVASSGISGAIFGCFSSYIGTCNALFEKLVVVMLAIEMAMQKNWRKFGLNVILLLSFKPSKTHL